MATYKVTDPTTGKSLSLTGDSPPSEQELNDIFSQVHGNQSSSLAQPQDSTMGQVAQEAAKSAFTAPYDATKAMIENPAEVAKQAPLAGAILGGPAGAGIGQIAKRVAGMAYGNEPSSQGPLKEALAPMVQTATGILDLPQVQGAITTGAKAVGRGATRLGEALSGVPASDIEQLFKKPSTLFKIGSKAKAGKAIGEEKTLAGVNPGVTKDITTLTPENVTKALNIKTTGSQALNSVLAGEKTPENIGDALKYVSDEIKGRLAQGKDASELINIQSHLNNMLGEVAPDVQAARQEFAPLAQRNKFLQLAPRNKSGTVSKANLLYLTSLMGGLGGTLGGAHGAAEAVALGAIARAPLTTGLVTSGLGGISKLAQTDAVRRAALASFIDKYTTKNPE